MKKVTVADCPNAPKLDPRVRRTRNLLENALRELLAEKPYDDISVGDIAERATVNRATFYAHFVDKRDLTATLIGGELHSALIACMPRDASVEESLMKVAVALFEFLQHRLGPCSSRAGEFAPELGPTLQDTTETFLRTWLEHDPKVMRAFPGASRASVATVVAWGLYGSGYRWSQQHRRVPVEKAASEVVALLIKS